jgi:alpha-galactosidase
MAKRGIITGKLEVTGRTPVEITIANAKGKTSGTLTIVAGEGGSTLAMTPPLGWNSWNAWGNTVTAARVQASADGMVASGLHRQGYTYINIDDVWEGGMEPNPATGRGRNVAGARDANGDPTTNANFPDMKGLVDHIHSIGLKAACIRRRAPPRARAWARRGSTKSRTRARTRAGASTI